MTSFLPLLRKIILASAYGCLIIAGVSFSLQRHGKLARLKRQNAALQENIRQRRQSIHDLKTKIGRMQWDPLFVERILHDNHRIRDNEIVYFIHGPETP